MEHPVTAEELAARFGLTAHVENGAFAERHYKSEGEDRPASGSIYYYVSPEEYTEFHSIDCDEYWSWVAGTTLEIWQYAPDGALTVTQLGTEEGCEPLLYLRAGTVFASRHPRREREGTFLVCLTVPRFRADGFTLIPREEMLRLHPDAVSFFRLP